MRRDTCITLYGAGIGLQVVGFFARDLILGTVLMGAGMGIAIWAFVHATPRGDHDQG